MPTDFRSARFRAEIGRGKGKKMRKITREKLIRDIQQLKNKGSRKTVTEIYGKNRDIIGGELTIARRAKKIDSYEVEHHYFLYTKEQKLIEVKKEFYENRYRTLFTNEKEKEELDKEDTLYLYF